MSDPATTDDLLPEGGLEKRGDVRPGVTPDLRPEPDRPADATGLDRQDLPGRLSRRPGDRPSSRPEPG